MKSAYFREGQHYNFSSLQNAFSLDAEKTRSRIHTLKRYNVLKTVRREQPEYSDLSDQDIIVGEIPDDSSAFSYQFTFVGVILLDDFVLKCYPKYIDIDAKKEPESVFEKFKTVIKVIEKYNQKEQLVHLYNGEAESKVFNRLAISLHILHDYFDNGLYSNQEEIIEQNGDGEILWDKTINETFAFIKNNTPYYLETFTHDNTENDFDYIRRLHAAIVTKCTRDLNVENLLALFDLEGAELTEQTLDDFGDTDYIKYRLEREIKKQFVTRKQNLLKTLYTYISELSSNQSDVSFSLYGTNAFNLVWETACGAMFKNIYADSWTVQKMADENLLEKDFVTSENKTRCIADYVERPEWRVDGESVEYDGRLIPDIISLRKEKSGNTALYILDGKYYLLLVQNKKLRGNPGIEDVVKQYAYNAALKSFIDEFRIGEIANAFLIPALESETAVNQNFADVPYWTAQHQGFKELPTLQVIKLKPSDVWSAYLGKANDTARVFDLIQKSPTANYLYHNENDDSIIQITDGKKHILVGFLRKEYFDVVENCIASGIQDFPFYFYATGIERDRQKFTRYPMHPYIDSCTEIILYTEDKTQFIRGKLTITKSHRCKIDEMTAENLKRMIDNSPFKMNDWEPKAKTYYVMTVENAVYSNNPYENIADFQALESKIKENGLNDVLFRTSPKVIDV